MTREELAELIGVAMTKRLTGSRDFWEWPCALRVRALADAVASDIFDQVQEGTS